MTNSGAKVQHSMQGVFVFVLLGLFAMMSTLMVLLGAQMYRGTVASSDANNEYRVLSAYVRSMIRAEDNHGAVRVETVDGITALAMSEMIEGKEYITWIYPYEGSLYELFTSREGGFSAEEGTPICPISSFAAQVEGSLVTVEMADANGTPCSVKVALRSAQ